MGGSFLQGLLLFHKTSPNSYLEPRDGPARPSSTMDRFERCFSIFRLSEEDEGAEDKGAEPGGRVPGQKRWRAVRVDLVVAPVSQFAFALLGWTGSKVTVMLRR